MTKQCMAACGICDLVCHDVFESTTCQSWARTGGCEKNPTFMLRGCGKTCEGCESGRKKKRFSIIISFTNLLREPIDSNLFIIL